MKICMFTNTYLPHVGGVAKSVASFSEDLRKRGHEVLIVAPVYHNDHENNKPEPEIIRLTAVCG
jgi:1,2-diacylglycerol 3-alpha-glucosyltransferase